MIRISPMGYRINMKNTNKSFCCSVTKFGSLNSVFATPEVQHARLPCPSLSPGVCSNSCPLTQWCHLTFLSSVIPIFSCPQSFPASESFPRSWLFASGGQSFSSSASSEYLALVSFRINWFDFLAVQKTLKSLLQHHISKASILQCSAFFIVQLSHAYMTTWKTIALTIRTFVSKVMSLLFNTLSRFVIVIFFKEQASFKILWI